MVSKRFAQGLQKVVKRYSNVFPRVIFLKGALEVLQKEKSADTTTRSARSSEAACIKADPSVERAASTTLFNH